MKAARLYGPRDLRIESVPFPVPPGPGEVLVQITAVGICGSDLHIYKDGGIEDTHISSPFILGHEFAGVVREVGPAATDGQGLPLSIGQRVALDPAMPCGYCEYCERGDPNLCPQIVFCGHYPEEGALSEFRRMPSRNCFPVPASISDAEAMLLEPLGVALHALHLAKVRLGESAAILGAGPVGLLILSLARLQGIRPLWVTEPLPWRAALAERCGADRVMGPGEDPVQAIHKETQGRGVDVVFEAAWGEETVQQAMEIASPGGRVVLVGISAEDRLSMKASGMRRKGLTVKMSRRMKHTYPATIRIAEEGRIPLGMLVSHQYPLEQAAVAYEANARYAEGVVKVMISPQA